LAALTLALLAGFGIWRISRLQSTSSIDTEGVSGAAPEFRLAALDGRQIGPQDYEGKVLLLDFWATWCKPCHLQAEILADLYPQFRAQGVEFLAVSLGEDEEAVRDFVTRRPFPYPVLIDPQDELAGRLGIVAFPALMVIDRQARVAFFQQGLVDGETLERVLRGAAG